MKKRELILKAESALEFACFRNLDYESRVAVLLHEVPEIHSYQAAEALLTQVEWHLEH